MKICIFGGGSIGGLLAVHLKKYRNRHKRGRKRPAFRCDEKKWYLPLLIQQGKKKLWLSIVQMTLTH